MQAYVHMQHTHTCHCVHMYMHAHVVEFMISYEITDSFFDHMLVRSPWILLFDLTLIFILLGLNGRTLSTL